MAFGSLTNNGSSEKDSPLLTSAGDINMTRECRCSAKPLAIDSKFFIVIPGRIHFFHVMVVLLGATAQDLTPSTATCTAPWPHSPLLFAGLGRWGRPSGPASITESLIARDTLKWVKNFMISRVAVSLGRMAYPPRSDRSSKPGVQALSAVFSFSKLGLLEKGTCLSEAFSDQIKAPKAPK